MLSAMLPSSPAGLQSPLASASTSSVTYADLSSFVWSGPLDLGSSDTSTAYSRRFASFLPTATVPRSSESKSSASPSPVAKRPASHPSDSGSLVSPSQVAQRVRTVFNSSNAVLSTPAAVPASASEPRQSTYGGLGHGFPSHLRDSGSYTHLPSIPEDRPLDIYHTPRKPAQHAGLPSPPRRADAPLPSASVSAHIPLRKRLLTTVHGLFSPRRAAKRPVFSIPEFRSQEASAAQSTVKGTGQQQPAPQRVHTPMSPMMLLAAQSILEEDRKCRKKEGRGKLGPKNGAQMSRLAAQVANCQTHQAGSTLNHGNGKGSPKSKLGFLF
ncbi:hypothetical protein C8R43DRAFT_1164715 [Mycena crocata]|nr:hypothetical protein C8R43DRAFT_1164715 [Mycena crocata]